MALSQFFSGVVVLVCAIHLAGVVGRSLFSVSAKSVLENEARQPRQRSDWYLFFHCSDLTGAESRASQAAVREPVQTPREEMNAPRQGKRRPRAGAAC